jgi:hypothetical protein
MIPFARPLMRAESVVVRFALGRPTGGCRRLVRQAIRAAADDRRLRSVADLDVESRRQRMEPKAAEPKPPHGRHLRPSIRGPCAIHDCRRELGVEHDFAARDAAHRIEQHIDVGHAVLEQVSHPGRVVLEQLLREHWLQML